ncbi:probable malonyl-CoA-acyl carrier protein transacylase, mitochondrial [Hyalella azteca]|uniref:Probable malonyl-CoA-acyl carrier protein transacylase, mitochondrial n=1 Tax=Hyalella azteca TaxID=294128 RepID=A0A8B7NWA7_HYAAZ|nr:probable malonyl-CoA-acyl carrier protein transacylase, mitochondrial [Hyalella azteca]
MYAPGRLTKKLLLIKNKLNLMNNNEFCRRISITLFQSSFHAPEAVGYHERNLLFQLNASSLTQNEDSTTEPSKRPDPKTTSILLFPNQGSQYVGMAVPVLGVPSVQQMYEEASEVLGFDLLEVSLHGPKEKLDEPQVAHPAVLVASLAAAQKLLYDNPLAIRNCVTAGGYGLGELTALAFSGVFSFQDAVRVCQFRALAISAACEGTSGGLASVTYGAGCRLQLCCDAAVQFCARQQLPEAHCSVAAHHWSTCSVIAATEEALEFLEKYQQDLRLKSVRRLASVPGPLHSPLLRPASDALAKMLSGMSLKDPIVPVVSACDVKYYTRADHVLKKLPAQLKSAIKWQHTINKLYTRKSGRGFPQTYICGPGQTMSTEPGSRIPRYRDHHMTVLWISSI